ncbi:pleckstrin homology domain-containing family A member 8 [Bacillus rossius redtenbacheri]|uniref:pleckstrin homology domain-containing family A member 8 n=1 Tax=Bacillus rossius redtenbacheri TaxID=93214 RepID=UPI002FDCD6B6
MSASNGGITSEDEKNFFSSVQHPFPDVENGKVPTLHFLEASKGVVALVEHFGKMFSPIRYDMSGNIEKLSKAYSTDVSKFTYLNDMILLEQQSGGNIATDALLWLRRALHLVHNFFQCIVEDAEKGLRTENLVPFLRQAYEEVLLRYHGWMAQQLFSLLSKMSPSRKDLLLALALGFSNREDVVIRDMRKFLRELNSNIEVLCAFYAEHGLESSHKV